MPGLPRKLGSVGVAAGPHESPSWTETGTILPTGASGEIAVRGVTVMEGYDRDPIGTATAFSARVVQDRRSGLSRP
jgi:long-subunit acyl-CoA synthetase (AMP-forming)